MIAALLDHLWQSTLFAAAVCLVVPLFRRNGASVRFWLWFSASAKFLVPLSIFVAAGRHLLAPMAPAMPARVLSAMQPVADPFSANLPVLAMPAMNHLMLLDAAASAWAVGVAALLLRWLLHTMRLRAILRHAADLPVMAPVPVKSTASMLEPGLVGIWRPVILLPSGIAGRLSAREMEAVIAHELCHLRRRDNLLGALQMLIEATFWFHPLVWWLGGRLVEAREQACDESVLAAGNHPVVYAEGILKVCRFYMRSPLTCASGVSGGVLEIRVGAILANRDVREIEAPKCVLLGAMAVSLVLIPLLAGGMGSAPVTRLATQVATVLAAPSQLARLPASADSGAQKRTAPAGRPRGWRHSSTTARAQADDHNTAALTEPLALPPGQNTTALEPPNTAQTAPVPKSPDVQPAAANDPDALICRPPQQLPASRFFGPQVCKTKAVWAQYRKDGMDVAADGVHDIPTEKWRTVNPPACGHGATGSASTMTSFVFNAICF